MGSMLRFESDRRELVRARRNERIERKHKRRQDREHKRSQTAAIPVADTTTLTAPATQRIAQQRVRETVERTVEQAPERHGERAATPSAAARPTPDNRHAPVSREQPTLVRARSSSTAPTTRESNGEEPPTVAGAIATREPQVPRIPQVQRVARRDRDLAEFRERRQLAVEAARREARFRIARAGELACVADALAALAHPDAGAWLAEREQLARALETGRIVEVAAAARGALWSISRDAARSSRRARRDPDLALAACVAYAIIARVPRSALRSAQRARPAPHARAARQRAFWR